MTSRVCEPRAGAPLTATPPIPLDAYADPCVHSAERASMFDPSAGPLYLGHRALLDRPGHRRADGDDRLLLTRDADGRVRAFANLCPHALRPLTLTDDLIERSCVTCPFHQWSFRRDGSFAGARDARDTPFEGVALHEYPLLEWNGFVFAVGDDRRDELERDLARVDATFAERGYASWLDPTRDVVLASEDEHYRGDWKVFMEVYGDCYHVPPYHPDLASFADCATLQWEFGERTHVQFVDLPANGAARGLYGDWIRGLERYHAMRAEPMPRLAVAWAAVYPNLMIECYAGLRVISVVIPTGPATYINRVHYLVPGDMERLVPGLPAAILTAYSETAVEDRILVESRHDGLMAARSLGIDWPGYRPNLTATAPELGTAHFHDWWHRALR